MKISAGSGRGSVYNILLKALQSGDKYGYEICKEIEEKSQGNYILKQPSLYSGLKRLEAQNLITSYWKDSEIGGRRHYYSLTDAGKAKVESANFSWSDERDELVGAMFQKSELDKSLDSVKTDVQNIENNINALKTSQEQYIEVMKETEQLKPSAVETKQQVVEQKEVVLQDLAEKPQEEQEKTDISEKPKQVKKSAHPINFEQQDLFSFISSYNTEKEDKSDDKPAEIKAEAQTELPKEEKPAEIITELKTEEKPQEEKAEEKQVTKPETTVDLIEDKTITPISSNEVEKEQEKPDAIFASDVNLSKIEPEETEKSAKPEPIPAKEELDAEKPSVLEQAEPEKKVEIVEQKQEIPAESVQETVMKAEEPKTYSVLDTNDEFDAILQQKQGNKNSFLSVKNESTEQKPNRADLEQSFTFYGSGEKQVEDTTELNFVIPKKEEEKLPEEEHKPSEETIILSKSSEPIVPANSILAQTTQVKTQDAKPKQSIDFKNIFGDLLTDTDEVSSIKPAEQSEISPVETVQAELPRIDAKTNVNITLRPKERDTFSSSYQSNQFKQSNAELPQQIQQTKPAAKISDNQNRIPFDQKYAQTAFDIQDYEIRYYKKPSLDKKLTRFVASNKLDLLTAIVISLLLLVCSGMLFYFGRQNLSEIQLASFVIGLIAIIGYFVINLMKYLVDSDKRKPMPKFSQIMVNRIFLAFILVILTYAFNLFLGMTMDTINLFMLSFYVPISIAVGIVADAIIKSIFSHFKFLYQ